MDKLVSVVAVQPGGGGVEGIGWGHLVGGGGGVGLPTSMYYHRQ